MIVEELNKAGYCNTQDILLNYNDDDNDIDSQAKTHNEIWNQLRRKQEQNQKSLVILYNGEVHVCIKFQPC